MNLMIEFVTAWKAGVDHNALLEMVHRHQADGLSPQEAYRTLHELWLESGFNDAAESNPLQDNLEYVLDKIWYEGPAVK